MERSAPYRQTGGPFHLTAGPQRLSAGLCAGARLPDSGSRPLNPPFSDVPCESRGAARQAGVDRKSTPMTEPVTVTSLVREALLNAAYVNAFG